MIYNELKRNFTNKKKQNDQKSKILIRYFKFEIYKKSLNKDFSGKTFFKILKFINFNYFR